MESPIHPGGPAGEMPRQTPPPSFEGDLSSLAIADLLGYLEARRHSGSLSVEHDDGQSQIAFDRGRICDARHGELRGDEAIKALIGVTEGRFALDRAISNTEASAKTMERSAIQALLEAAIETDEGQRDDALARRPSQTTLQSAGGAEEEPAAISERTWHSFPRMGALAAIATLGAISLFAASRSTSTGSDPTGDESGRRPETAVTIESGGETLGQQKADLSETPFSRFDDEVEADAELVTDPALRLETAAALPSEDPGPGDAERDLRSSTPPAVSEVATAPPVGLPAPSRRPEVDSDSTRRSATTESTRSEPVPQQHLEQRERPEAQARTTEPVVPAPEPKGKPRLRLPDVWVGDLVEPGPDVVQPRLRSVWEPRVSRDGLSRAHRAGVVLRVLVDHLGRVEAVEVPDAGFSSRDARRLRSSAAELEFEPAVKQGVAVRTWTTLTLPGG